MRHKFSDIYGQKLVDLLFVSETKLDSSFRNDLFLAPGYKLERCDRNSRGGGIAAFIRAEIHAHRLESKNLENITYEVILNNSKWAVSCVYRPPKMSASDFFQNLTLMTDHILTKFDHFMIIGDLHYDLQCDRSRQLIDFAEIFDLHCLVKDPTCFKKNCTPSLLDVILTNS